MIRRAGIAAWIAAGAILLGTPVAWGQAGGEAYRLGPDDHVRVTVYGLPDLSGEFRVSAGGTVALPLAGDVMASGLSAVELARRITERLQPLLSISPNTTVAVIERRPVYVLGDVAAPGAFEYSPRMRVLQLLARAGGLRAIPTRGDDSALSRIGVEADLARYASQLLELKLRRARLEAERAGAETLEQPAVARGPNYAALFEHERSLLMQRRGSLDRGIALLDLQKAEYGRELEALAAQSEAKKQEIALLSEMLSDQESLLERGLVRQTRLLEFQRQVLAEQAALIQIGAFEARARQNIARIDREIADLRAARSLEIIAGLRDVAQQSALLEAEIFAAERRLEALGGAARHVGGTRFTLRREVDGALARIDVDEATILQPGDLLIVEMPRLSATLGLLAENPASQDP